MRVFVCVYECVSMYICIGECIFCASYVFKYICSRRHLYVNRDNCLKYVQKVMFYVYILFE